MQGVLHISRAGYGLLSYGGTWMGGTARRQWTMEWKCRTRLTYRPKQGQVHPSDCGWEVQESRNVTAGKQRPAPEL